MDLIEENCTSKRLNEWIKFLNLNFQYVQPQSYANDFAPLFENEVLKNAELVLHKDQIISSATLYVANVITPKQSLNIGIIGAVATSDSFRGNGISKRLILKLEEKARLQKLDALVLWSDQNQFYQKIGFQKLGSQEIFSLHQLKDPIGHISGHMQNRWDWDQVKRLYENHSARINRSKEYWLAIQKIKYCNQLQWVDDDGNVLAYLGYNRGKDYPNVIHEWGGESKALHHLVSSVLKSKPDLLWLTHPKLHDPIRGKLSYEASLLMKGHLALIKSLTEKEISFDDVWFWGLDSL